MHSNRCLTGIAASLLCSATLAPSLTAAEEVREADSLTDALAHGTASMNLRLRFENVDQDGGAGSDLDAQALTLRALMSYKTQSWRGWFGKVTFEHTAAIPDDSNYNSTTNGETDQAVIADPEETELDEAFASYIGIEDTSFTVGRQVINHDNQRHVGAVAWRQNRQTFDAARVEYTGIEHLRLDYAVVFNANRIFTDENEVLGDAPQLSHFAHGSYKLEDVGTASAYIYLLDFEKAGDDGSGSDSQTIGARFDGKHSISEEANVIYDIELASQSDFADRSDSFSAMYLHVNGGVAFNGLSVSIGLEVLGSDDGTAAFQTPHATLHAFNGWADQFLATPADGLEDRYISVGARVSAVPGLKLEGSFHNFSGDDSGDDFGNELDAIATYQFQDIDNLSAGAKLALYAEDGFATDTSKFWLWTQWSF